MLRRSKNRANIQAVSSYVNVDSGCALKCLARGACLVLFFGLSIIAGASDPVRADTSTMGMEEKVSPFRIVDALGHEITFKKVPRRIVVVGRGPFMALHLLYMFQECRDRLVGYEEKLKGSNQFLPLIDSDFHDKKALADNPGPEQIAALRPDVVITKGTTPMTIGDALTVLGIPVVYLSLENPESFLDDLRTVGRLFGNPGRAEEIRSFYTSRLLRIKEGLEGLQEKDRPLVLVMEYSNRGGKAAVRVPARSWIQTIQAVTAGGRAVWLEEAQPTDGWTITHFEQIAAWDPDKIFAIIWFLMDSGKAMDSLQSDPRWRLLRAVENRELYAFPADLFGWDTPAPRWILGMLWLAKTTHPYRFKDLDIREEIYAFFGRLYGLDKAAIDSKILPHVVLGER